MKQVAHVNRVQKLLQKRRERSERGTCAVKKECHLAGNTVRLSPPISNTLLSSSTCLGSRELRAAQRVFTQWYLLLQGALQQRVVHENLLLHSNSKAEPKSDRRSAWTLIPDTHTRQ